MQKTTISYQEYDNLCSVAAKIKCKLLRLPTKEEIDLLTSCHIGHFLSLLTWLTESENGIPEIAENLDIREYINDKIDDGISEYMFFVKEPEEELGDKWLLGFDEYAQIFHIVEKIDFLDMNEFQFPTYQQTDEWFRPIIKYSFGFMLMLLEKNKAYKSSRDYSYMKNLVNEYYELSHVHKLFNMTSQEYENLCNSMKNCHIQRGKWWPSEEEINGNIIPNLKLCYDFVLWILNTGPEPVTKEEKESEKLLKKIIRDNTNISQEGEIPWL